MEEYKTKVKEITDEEEPFIKEGQGYFSIGGCFNVGSLYYCGNEDYDNKLLNDGNMFPFTEENKDKVRKEVELIAERRKLQSEMEMFARLNNEEEIDWKDTRQGKYYLYIDYTENNIEIGYALCSRHFNTVYFTSEEIAQKALDKFGDRIRELYLKQEEQ